MGTRARKSILILLLCVILACSAAFAAMMVRANADGSGIFTDKEVTENYVLPDFVGIDDARKGLHVTATGSGETFAFRNKFTGKFEIDFRIFSDDTYNTDTISGSTFENPFIDFGKLIFKFTDVEIPENTFDVVIEAGSRENFVSPNAYVAYKGENRGIYYPVVFDGYLDVGYNGINQSKWHNAQGLYTYLQGSTFCNKAYYCNKFDDAPISTIIGFDPETMEVYSYAYDQNGTLGKRTILDLDAGMNDAMLTPELSGFATYNVEMIFEQIGQGEVADMIVYSINDYAFNGEADTAAPIVYADINDFTDIGGKYYLTPAYVSDVMDGLSDFSGEITVTQEDGTTLSVQSDENGKYVTPETAGEMTVTYKAKDSAQNEGEFVKKVTIFANLFNHAFETKLLPEGTYGFGTRLDLSTFEFVDESLKDIKLYYRLDHGETKGEEIEIVEGENVLLNEVGAYSLTITAEDFVSSLVYNYEVSEGEVAFVFDVPFKENYMQGDVLELPEVKVNCKGKEAQTDLVILMPSGRAVTAQSKFYFTESGKYTFTYSAILDGIEYIREYEIYVSDTEKDFTTVSSVAVTEEKYATSYYTDTLTGTRLSNVQEGGKVIYNNTIDLTSYDNDLLLSFYSDERLFEPATDAYITLTDVGDPANYLTIRLYLWYYNPPYSDIEETLAYSMNNGTATATRQALYSREGYTAGGNGYNNTKFRLYYNYEGRFIYANYWSDQPTDNSVVYIDDLYPNWNGWTTGEVQLSIEINNPILIETVDGRSFVKDDLMRDSVAPAINVDMPAGGFPDAMTGSAYSLPDATARDETDGIVNVTCSVYTYYNSFKRLVCINKDSFVPETAGTYYIEYSAVDKTGNIGTVVFEISAKPQEAFEELSISVTYPDTINAGIEFTLPDYTVRGGSGNINVDVSVILPDETEQKITDGVFTPLAAGKFTFVYKLTDYVGNTETFEYGVTVALDQKPILREVDLPFSYVLSGSKVEFPVCYSKQFVNGVLEDAELKIEVQVEGQDAVVLEDEFIYVPEIEPGTRKEMSVVYYAENSFGRTALDEKTVTVVNPYTSAIGNFSMKDFFVHGAGITSETGDSQSYIDFTINSDDEIYFVNKLLAKRVSFQFSIPTAQSMNALVITLTDSVDASVKVQFRLTPNGTENSWLQVNGGKNVSVSGGFGNNQVLSLSYSNATFYIGDGGNGILAAVENNLGGGLFSGFPSGYVYLSIDAEGVTSPTNLHLMRINGQTFSNLNYTPLPAVEYEIERFISSEVSMGQTLEIPKIKVNTVLYPVTDITVTVVANGKTVLQNQPNDNYSIQIETDDDCTITYSAKTIFGQTLRVVSYGVSVAEYEPPVITVNGSVATSAKVGDTITLPTMTATDNMCGTSELQSGTLSDSEWSRLELQCHLIVINPRLKATELYKEDLTYTFTFAGTYRVRYYAIDKTGNFASQDFIITVK